MEEPIEEENVKGPKLMPFDDKVYIYMCFINDSEGSPAVWVFLIL
jgi:hypothetical protein